MRVAEPHLCKSWGCGLMFCMAGPKFVKLAEIQAKLIRASAEWRRQRASRWAPPRAPARAAMSTCANTSCTRRAPAPPCSDAGNTRRRLGRGDPVAPPVHRRHAQAHSHARRQRSPLGPSTGAAGAALPGAMAMAAAPACMCSQCVTSGCSRGPTSPVAPSAAQNAARRRDPQRAAALVHRHDSPALASKQRSAPSNTLRLMYAAATGILAAGTGRRSRSSLAAASSSGSVASTSSKPQRACDRHAQRGPGQVPLLAPAGGSPTYGAAAFPFRCGNVGAELDSPPVGRQV